MYKLTKALVICAVAAAAICWLGSSSSSHAVFTGFTEQTAQTKPAAYKSDDYVGSDTCKACHEDQFKNFSHKSHAQLTKLCSWKEQVTGCE